MSLKVIQIVVGGLRVVPSDLEMRLAESDIRGTIKNI